MKVHSKEAGKPVPSGMKVWRFFSSLRLALILMLILIGLSLIGTFVIQIPAESTSTASSYEWWLQNIAQPQTGIWYPLLRFFGFFDIFHSNWFLGAGSLLIISIIICSLNRWRQTHAYISLSPVKQAEGFYKVEKSPSGVSGIPIASDKENSITQVLRKRRYALRYEDSSGNLYLAADKHRFSPLGTYAIHLSLILFITGFLIGSYMGFKDTNFVVPEGSTRDIGHNTGLGIRLNSFADEYWPNGSPKDYRSDVAIMESNQIVKSAVVQVNHPVSYKGIRIYQSFFGPAALIQISDAEGKELFKGNIALNVMLESHPFQRPSGGFRLIQEGYMLYLIGRAENINDTVLSEEQIGFELYKTNSNTPVASTKLDKGVPYKAGTIQVTYLNDTRFSGFQVSRDPGNNLIWIASGLFLLGLIVVFYFPRRRIWALVEHTSDKGNRLWLRTDSGSRPGASAEFEDIIREIKSGQK